MSIVIVCEFGGGFNGRPIHGESRLAEAVCGIPARGGQSVEGTVKGCQARRLARAVSLGPDYKPTVWSLLWMPRLTVVLEASIHNGYAITVRSKSENGVQSFLFAKLL